MKKLSATEFCERRMPMFYYAQALRVIDLANSIPPEKVPGHYHPAYVGSEYACKKCNPICWVNHQFADPERMRPCQTDDCPLRR